MKIFIAAVLACVTVSCYRELPFPDDEEAAALEILPAWQEGYMDIHHISTGRGNCTFMILPDGTTMMIDAGDLGSTDFTQEIMGRLPYTSRTPGEWIVRYVSHFLKAAGLPASHLDYMLVTHFHNDHIGTPSDYSIASISGKYSMAGVSYVGNFLEIEMFVDRGWPDYDHPFPGALDNSMMDNYREFLKDRRENHTYKEITTFEVGTTDQFVLRKSAEAYPDFCIRNIYGSGQIWTGNEDDTEYIVPSGIAHDVLSNENLWSAVINVSYGDFDYHTGGDILGNYGDWRNVESKVGRLIGETDVYNCDHHAYKDAMIQDVIDKTSPQAFVIPVWDYYHPESAPLSRMLDSTGPERMVFAAGLVASNRTRLLEDGEKIKPDGHVVVRVYEGGNEFQIYVLNDRTSDYEVIYKTERLTSNR